MLLQLTAILQHGLSLGNGRWQRWDGGRVCGKHCTASVPTGMGTQSQWLDEVMVCVAALVSASLSDGALAPPPAPTRVILHLLFSPWQLLSSQVSAACTAPPLPASRGGGSGVERVRGERSGWQACRPGELPAAGGKLVAGQRLGGWGLHVGWGVGEVLRHWIRLWRCGCWRQVGRARWKRGSGG